MILHWTTILTILVFALFAACTGYGITRLVLTSAANSKDGGEPQDAGEQAQNLRGGTWIGILERVAIVVAVMCGHPAAIAYVIAIKGLGRYPELKNHPGASERFVIGTLTSMLWAALCGLLGLLVITLVAQHIVL